MQNAIYLEADGNGGLVSINYERQFDSSSPIMIRVGLGYIPTVWNSNPIITFPISMHYLFDLGRTDFLDLSLGATILTGEESGALWFPSIGYRQNFSEGWMWCIHITYDIFYSEGDNQGWVPWVGICLGKRF
jgi:hypothetical protein